MARTTKPLTIAITDPDLLNTLEVQELIGQGHVVEYVTLHHDLIIGSRCWRIIPHTSLLKAMLKIMLKAVRNVKYPKKGGK